GGNGNDTIAGYGGEDNIDAGPGDDTVYGGRGMDKINCGEGSDTAYVSSGGEAASTRGCETIITPGGKVTGRGRAVVRQAVPPTGQACPAGPIAYDLP